ncbi:hypothetical protein FACS1894103_6640 [Campylobacterota bacterium]|nr:hypothetical protein FACS1894103_6640 [Campylobacterota bacterium]
MISPELISFFYNAASMKRWNDYPTLIDLTELDKQAHKIMIAFFLASHENDIDHNKLIESFIFEFLRRVIVTDLRPDVFHEVIDEKILQINEWALNNIKQIVEPIENGKFFERIKSYFLDSSYNKNERDLLAAAHYLSTRYEFAIVYQSASFLSDIETLKKSVESEIDKFTHYKGVVEIGLGGKLSRIVDLCGRLRFQIRWSQTPRLPKTSVLGHELIVALFSYFYSLSVNACQKRVANNFYCALFHELYELLGDELIAPLEAEQTQEAVRKRLLDFYAKEMKRLRTDGQVETLMELRGIVERLKKGSLVAFRRF